MDSQIIQETKDLKIKVEQLENERKKAIKRLEFFAKDSGLEIPNFIKSELDPKLWKYFIFDSSPLGTDALVSKEVQQCIKNCNSQYDIIGDREREDENIEAARVRCIAGCLKK